MHTPNTKLERPQMYDTNNNNNNSNNNKRFQETNGNAQLYKNTIIINHN